MENLFKSRGLYWAVFIAGLALMVSVWARSSGTPVDDEVTHVIAARAVWNFPPLVLDIWMRVANTVIWAVPSLFGLTGMRLFTVILSVATVLLTTDTAQRLGVRWLFLIPLMLFFQTWYIMLGFPASKSVPFMFYMVLGTFFWVRDRYGMASLAFGLLPLSRHEGILLAGLWFVYMLYRREWRAALLVWLPTALYNLIFLVWLQPASLDGLPFAIYLRPQGSTGGYYGSSGSFFYFVPQVIAAVGIPISVFALCGMPAMLRNGAKALILVPPAVYFLIHTLIYLFGLFDSGGYLMFLLAMAPAFAILAALGVQSLYGLITRFVTARQISAAGRAAFMLAVAGIVVFVGVSTPTPYIRNDFEQNAEKVADWLHKNNIAPVRVYSTYVWVSMLFDYSLIDRPEKKYVDEKVARNLKPGEVLIWDAKYGVEQKVPLEIFDSPEWRKLAEFGADRTRIIVFERVQS